MKKLLCLLFTSALALSCGGGGGSPDEAVDGPFDPAADFPVDGIWDQPYDPFVDPAYDPFQDPSYDPFEDSSADTPPDTPVDEPPETTYRFCVHACSSPEPCCTAAETCGSYPDRWSCDTGYCAGVGCIDDAECVAWASGYSLPGAAGYKCRGFEGGYRSCVAGCSAAADCCPETLDCSAYPLRYLCDEGGCLMDGCLDDAECRSYAAADDLPHPELFVCRSLGISSYRTCFMSCSDAAVCCPPDHEPCTAYPYHYACTGGLCTNTCGGDAECQAYAASSGLSDPGSYVCRDF